MAPKINEVLQGLRNSQDADEDNREMSKEADLFLNKRDGQWEPEIYSAWNERPRYTLDQVNPVLDGIMGEMDGMDFGCVVDPNGGGATIKMAEAYAGMIRSIENMSKAKYLYRHASRVMTGQGISGWRVKTALRKNNPFVQDLVIEGIPNFKERVWFDEGSTTRDASDAKEAYVLTSLTLDDYEELFPKGSGMSVGENRHYHAYTQVKHSEVVIGEFYFMTTVKKKYVMLNNGKIFIYDEDFQSIQDELLAKGIKVVDEREIDKPVFKHQLFDGSDFLAPATDTVFSTCPVVPAYANWDLSENKVIYWGMVEKLMDPQRILNYAESKKVAESALKPIEKTWIEKGQAESADVREGLRTANTNSDPHQFYDHVDGVPPPFKQPPQQPDTVLVETAAASKQYIRDTSNFNAAVRGEGLSGQSNAALQNLQTKGNIGNYKYYNAMEIAIGRTGDLLVEGIPYIYDTPQEMMLINIDGTREGYNILETVYDNQSGRWVTINDLAVGTYQVTCTAGPAFKSQQAEASTKLLAGAQVYPPLLEMGADIFLRGLGSPAMGLVADRVRAKLVEGGMIPVAQLTEEEKKHVEEMAKNAKPDPMAEANLGIAKAEIEKAQANTKDIISKIEERGIKAEAANKQMMIDTQLSVQELQGEQKKMMIDFQLKQQELQDKSQDKMLAMMTAQADVLNIHADTLKKITEALTMQQTPGAVGAYSDQVNIIEETQQNVQ